MASGNQGQRLGPQQGGAFTLVEEGRFLPGADRHQAPKAFALVDRVGGVHVDAVGASVDLRSANPYQFTQGARQHRFGSGFLEAQHGLHGLRSGLVVVEALGTHRRFLQIGRRISALERTLLANSAWINWL
ncbi:hypothetical protein D3C72_1754950 [compost metagenome]